MARGSKGSQIFQGWALSPDSPGDKQTEKSNKRLGQLSCVCLLPLVQIILLAKKPKTFLPIISSTAHKLGNTLTAATKHNEKRDADRQIRDYLVYQLMAEVT